MQEMRDIREHSAIQKAERKEAMRNDPVLASVYLSNKPVPPQPPPPTAAEAEAIAQKVARIKALAASLPSASPLTIISAL